MRKDEFPLINEIRAEDRAKAYKQGKQDALDGLIANCKKASEVLTDMMRRCLDEDGKGASPTGCLSAYAYFDQQREIYEWMIPNIVEEYRETGKVREYGRETDNKQEDGNNDSLHDGREACEEV